MEINFSGKRALVTGAGKGIGRATARKLVECGAEVIVLSRTQSDLDSLKNEVSTIKTACVDLADFDETQKVVSSLGDVHLLVNNAGVNILEPFLDVAPENFDKLFSVNVKAPFFISQVIAKGMVSRGNGGAIVNVSSQASQGAFKGLAVYASSKAALDMMSKVMALELGPHNIRVNTVNPTVVRMTALGNVITGDSAKRLQDGIPLARFAEISEVVDVILFLLSDKASMVNGVTLPIDGGFLAT